DAEHAVPERLDDLAGHLDLVFLLRDGCLLSRSRSSVYGPAADGRPPPALCLDQADVRRLRALLTLLGLVLHLRALVERAVPRALNRAEVDEEVLAALVGGDEPIALVRVEPLDSSGCHISFHLLANFTERARKVQTGTIQLAQNCGRSVASAA